MKTLFKSLFSKNSASLDSNEEIMDAAGFKTAFLKALKNKNGNFNETHKKILFFFLEGLAFVLLLGILLWVHHQNHVLANLANNGNKQTTVILHQIDDINGQLQVLSASPENSKEFQIALVNMVNDFSNVKRSINDLAKTSDIQKVSNQVALMKSDFDGQIGDLKKDVAASSDSKQFLDPKVLPFHVIAVDVISEQPFISIDYAHHITPLAVGDSIAGWRIVAADYDAAEVELENNQNQYVKVQVQG